MGESVFPEHTLTEHLIELRTRLIRILLGLFLILLCLLPFSQNIYTFVAQPLIAALPEGNHMIATDVIAPFFVPIKVTLMLAFLISLPHTLYQIWAFIAPGLYKHEKKLILPIVFSSFVLFLIGMAFAYYLVFPTVFHFLAKVTPIGVNMATDIDKYLSFVLGMFVAFGSTFEVPVIVLILNKLGFVSSARLKSARPYVIVMAFIIAAIITPPDVVSQILLAIPLILLYEVGLFLCRFTEPTHQDLTPSEDNNPHESL